MANKKILINNKITGILSYPDIVDSFNMSASAVLFLHGFATDKDEINGIYKEMSSRLMIKNIVSLRIDFCGYGDSIGNTEDSSIDTMIADAIAGFNYLCQLPYINPNCIGIVGFSLGAAIAILALGNVACKSLALISPALDLPEDFTTFLSKEVMNRLKECDDFIEVDLGWRKIKLSKKFYDSLFRYKPLNDIQSYTCGLTCVAGERDFSAKNVESIYSHSSSLEKSKKIIKGADHIFNLTDGHSELSNVGLEVCSWIQKNLEAEKVTNNYNSTLQM